METIYLDKANIQSIPNLSICLGTFDGLHIGHQQLLIKAVSDSSGPVGILLFDSNPADIIDNGKRHRILTSLEDKIVLLNKLRLDYAFIVKADASFFSASPKDFIENYLLPLGVKKAFVGSDYRFGKAAEGDPSFLSKFIQVEEIPLLSIKGEKVSTQKIASLIEEGKIEDANGLLGRPYEIKGKIVEGYQNGRKIGFPTANLSLSSPYVLPRDGVYKGLGFLRGFPYQSMINVGKNPTLGLLKQDVVEAYLEGFKDTAYNETLYIDFLSFLREEKKFKDLEELSKQLQKDRLEILKK